MKCLQIIGASSVGGGTYLVMELCRYLVAAGVETHVLCTDPRTVAAFRQLKSVKVIDSICIPRDIHPYACLKAAHKTCGLIRSEQYDVVHTYTATPGFIGRVTAAAARVPVIVHHQAAWASTETSSRLLRFMYSMCEGIALQASSAAICVGHSVADAGASMLFVPNRKLVTICNGISAGRFTKPLDSGRRRALRAGLNVTDEHVLITSTGRLSRQKDCATLIRAVSTLATLMRGRPFAIVIAGDGPADVDLRSLAESLGVSDWIRMPGFRTDVADILRASDIYITTSLREGLSISVLEAMASGKPIVATDIPPNAELVKHESTGLLVPVRSPEAVAKAIARFVHEPGLAAECGRNARKKLLAEYALERMLDETFHLYRTLYAERMNGRAKRMPRAR